MTFGRDQLIGENITGSRSNKIADHHLQQNLHGRPNTKEFFIINIHEHDQMITA